jgi:hypothetical protein
MAKRKLNETAMAEELGAVASFARSQPASGSAGKPANQQTSKLGNQQDGPRVSPQAGAQVQVRKFTSYLREDSIKAMKRIALEADRKDYEVLQEAVDQYLSRQQKGG